MKRWIAREEFWEYVVIALAIAIFWLMLGGTAHFALSGFPL